MKAARLKFDPAELPPGGTGEDLEFFHWFREVKKHREFPRLEAQLARITQKFGEFQFEFEWNTFWQAWRAATWKPPLTAEQQNALENLLYRNDEVLRQKQLEMLVQRAVSLAAEGDVSLKEFRHGPFIWMATITGKTRLPTAATMYAALVADVLKRARLPINWGVVARLVAVTGIDPQAKRESLQVSARRLLDAIGAGEVVTVGWEQDSGDTINSAMRLLERIKAQTRVNPFTGEPWNRS